jgi:hypothetical protein
MIVLPGEHGTARTGSCQLAGHLGALPDEVAEVRVDPREPAAVDRDRLRAGVAGRVPGSQALHERARVLQGEARGEE